VVRAATTGRYGGFTLLEIMVALAILALVFGSAFRGLSGALDRLGRGHTAAEALVLAGSTLARVGADIPIGEEEVRGRTDDGFTWVVQTAPYDGPRPATGLLTGYVVQVSVAWMDRRNLRQVQLSTVRLALRGRAP
jgi:prepilin-type N-terminal cleavage/methylation domain-containing protein